MFKNTVKKMNIWVIKVIPSDKLYKSVTNLDYSKNLGFFGGLLIINHKIVSMVPSAD